MGIGICRFVRWPLLILTIAAALAFPVEQVTAAGSPRLLAGIEGYVWNPDRTPLGHHHVQLRHLPNGRLAALTRSNEAGRFSFFGLQPGTYVAELLGASGLVIGSSSPIRVHAAEAFIGVEIVARERQWSSVDSRQSSRPSTVAARQEWSARRRGKATNAMTLAYKSVRLRAAAGGSIRHHQRRRGHFSAPLTDLVARPSFFRSASRV